MAIDGRVLASAGINIGNQIGRATEQLGQNVGGMLTDVGRGFSERRSSREAQELLQQYANDPAQLNALGQKYQSMGKENVAKAFYEAAKAATAKDAAAAEKKANQVSALETGGQDIQKEAQLKRAIQVATQRGDQSSLVALRARALDPVEYLKGSTAPKETKILSAGAKLVDTEGNVLAEAPFKPDDTKQVDKAYELAKTGKFTPESIQDAVGPTGEVNVSLLVPVTEERERGNVGATAEKRNNAISEQSTKASVSLSRNRALQASLMESPDKSTGIVSELRTSALNLAGLRDAEEEDKTAFLRNRNTDIVNGLPPGVASDRDIDLFSQGFPEGSASTQEIMAYLQAEERILAAASDMALVSDRHLQVQIDAGLDATMVGFEAKKQQYGKIMSMARRDIEEKMANAQTAQERIKIERDIINQVAEVLGFVPKFYR
jgi:hypothetical protein